MISFQDDSIASLWKDIFKRVDGIGIEDIRKIREFIRTKPARKQYQAVIIFRLESATPEAQNALLKILEEPPLHVYILATSENSDLLLPTILSRAQVVHIKADKTDLLLNENIESILLTLTDLKIGDKILLAQKYGTKKEDAQIFLDQSIQNLRILLKNQYQKKPASTKLAPLYIASMLKKFTRAKFFLEKNINPRLTLEVLFFGLQ